MVLRILEPDLGELLTKTNRIPKGPSCPYLWLLVPKMDPMSDTREYLDP